MQKKKYGEDYMIEMKQRILEKKIINDKTKCWEWQGAKLKSGYGNIRFKGSSTTAHRVSYIVFIGPVEEGLIVRHKCHNKACVNPYHLDIGTQSENIQDSVRDGRFNRPIGSNHQNSKLNEEQVRKIRQEWEECYDHDSFASFCDYMGIRYGVHSTTIRDILKMKTWKHL